MNRPEPDVRGVPFREALAFWVRLGFINFGGPTGQIALMGMPKMLRGSWCTTRISLPSASIT